MVGKILLGMLMTLIGCLGLAGFCMTVVFVGKIVIIETKARNWGCLIALAAFAAVLIVGGYLGWMFL